MIPSWLVWAEIECTVHVALPKWPMNQFIPVHQSRQQVLRAYCPNLCTVSRMSQLINSQNILTNQKRSRNKKVNLTNKHLYLFLPRNLILLPNILVNYRLYKNLHIILQQYILRLLYAFLIQFKLVHGPFGQSNMHRTLHFCPNQPGRN